MKKQIIFTLLAFFLLIGISSCKEKSHKDDDNDSTSTNVEVTNDPEICEQLFGEWKFTSTDEDLNRIVTTTTFNSI
ncbi:MAG: hypothetical protein NC311_17850 [Muribaculaceae bacterium]|nr:hypothetical protein [Prevotella sp.]MCM1075675.1 hypothetical protein [Ruminococcus sp.]MCM1297405.1 hypothetical protein [Muribaculaceae bacterium]